MGTLVSMVTILANIQKQKNKKQGSPLPTKEKKKEM